MRVIPKMENCLSDLMLIFQNFFSFKKIEHCFRVFVDRGGFSSLEIEGSSLKCFPQAYVDGNLWDGYDCFIKVVVCRAKRILHLKNLDEGPGRHPRQVYI